MNPFQLPYIERLKQFRDLRMSLLTQTLEQQCIEIDRWWQQAPLIKHNLSWTDSDNWTDPWTMLSDNLYGPLDRAIGMCYTLLMIGVENVELVQAQDQQAEEHYLVLVNDYILNYWPNTILTNKLSDFTISKKLSTTLLKNKIK
jgi:hypothetical protein